LIVVLVLMELDRGRGLFGGERRRGRKA